MKKDKLVSELHTNIAPCKDLSLTIFGFKIYTTYLFNDLLPLPFLSSHSNHGFKLVELMLMNTWTSKPVLKDISVAKPWKLSQSKGRYNNLCTYKGLSDCYWTLISLYTKNECWLDTNVRILFPSVPNWLLSLVLNCILIFGLTCCIRELLKGPLYYATTITIACAIFWRTSPIAIAMICNLCAGDGTVLWNIMPLLNEILKCAVEPLLCNSFVLKWSTKSLILFYFLMWAGIHLTSWANQFLA